MRAFWIVSAIATLLFSSVVFWLVADLENGFIGRDYRSAVIPILSVCAIAVAVRLLGQTHTWTAAAVLCLDVVAVFSFLLALRRWPGGDDGRGLAFLLVGGAMLVALVFADVIAGAIVARSHWSSERSK